MSRLPTVDDKCMILRTVKAARYKNTGHLRTHFNVGIRAFKSHLFIYVALKRPIDNNTEFAGMKKKHNKNADLSQLFSGFMGKNTI